MYLWKIERTDEVDWDETRAVIVAAPHMSEARSYVMQNAPAYEGTWIDATVTCVGQTVGPEPSGPTILLADVKGA